MPATRSVTKSGRLSRATAATAVAPTTKTNAKPFTERDMCVALDRIYCDNVTLHGAAALGGVPVDALKRAQILKPSEEVKVLDYATDIFNNRGLFPDANSLQIKAQSIVDRNDDAPSTRLVDRQWVTRFEARYQDIMDGKPREPHISEPSEEPEVVMREPATDPDATLVEAPEVTPPSPTTKSWTKVDTEATRAMDELLKTKDDFVGTLTSRHDNGGQPQWHLSLHGGEKQVFDSFDEFITILGQIDEHNKAYVSDSEDETAGSKRKRKPRMSREEREDLRYFLQKEERRENCATALSIRKGINDIGRWRAKLDEWETTLKAKAPEFNKYLRFDGLTQASIDREVAEWEEIFPEIDSLDRIEALTHEEVYLADMPPLGNEKTPAQKAEAAAQKDARDARISEAIEMLRDRETTVEDAAKAHNITTHQLEQAMPISFEAEEKLKDWICQAVTSPYPPCKKDMREMANAVRRRETGCDTAVTLRYMERFYARYPHLLEHIQNLSRWHNPVYEPPLPAGYHYAALYPGQSNRWGTKRMVVKEGPWVPPDDIFGAQVVE